MKKAVILLSGGLDSATCIAIAKDAGFELYTMSFRYGQKHNIELQYSEKIAKQYNSTHKIIDIDLSVFKGSALVDSKIEVPKNSYNEDIIPVTYVPARNTLFLSYALAWAETLGSYDIFIGANAVDYSGYPDCRPEYINSYEKMANLAVSYAKNSKITIHAPLINYSKSEIISIGNKLNVDYSKTISCYDPVEQLSCGSCDSCILRKKGFSDLGVKDPTFYISA